MTDTSATPNDSDKPFQIRISQIDYTVVPPSAFDRSNLPRVPVIRVYGQSTTGKSACVHIHQVYPYIFLEYPGKVEPRHVTRYISLLFNSLNHALALSLKRQPKSPKSQYVRAILLVKGVPFYGFHASYSPFLKVLMADPALHSRTVALLQSGSVMGTRFRVYESHLSYILQFLSDFNLYGCGLLDFQEAAARGIDEGDEDEDEPTLAQIRQRFAPSTLFRESRVQLELDIIAPQILNRQNIVARNIHNVLHTTTAEQPSEPYVMSVRELWDDERAHRRALGLNPSPVIPLDPTDSSRGDRSPWISEARWWDALRQRILSSGETPMVLPLQNAEKKWESYVMTTFESVEALWEKKYRKWSPKKPSGATGDLHHLASLDPQRSPSDDNTSVDVDLAAISGEFMTEFSDPRGQTSVDITQDLEQINDEHEASDEEPETAGNGEVDEDSIVREPTEKDPFLEDLGSDFNDGQLVEYRLTTPPLAEDAAAAVQQGSLTPTRQSEMDVDRERTPTQPLSLEDVGKASRRVIFVDADSPASEAREDMADLEELSETASQLVATQKSKALIAARTVLPSTAFRTCKASSSNRYEYDFPPPSKTFLIETLEELGLPRKLYRPPHYSDDNDLPESDQEFGGRLFRLKGGQGIATLDEWVKTVPERSAWPHPPRSKRLYPPGVAGWEYAASPPSAREVRKTIDLLIPIGDTVLKKETSRSQIEGPTQANPFGFEESPQHHDDSLRDKPVMTLLSLEIFVPTREDKVPDPDKDTVVAVFYAFHSTGMEITRSGVLALDCPQLNVKRLRTVNIESFQTELDLLNGVIDLTVDLDPDIVVGWDVQTTSWGFLEARAKTLGLSISDLISRAPPREIGAGNDRWALRKSSTFKISGRHVFNLWRIMRSEKTLTIYTFENFVFNILKRRVPRYNFKILTQWYNCESTAQVMHLVNFLRLRTRLNLELLEATETVTKTAEFARVFGVDFFSVISRGSQFKVESFMFRIAKPESFVLISPSPQEVGKQNAAECMPLIMEPASAFYTSPMVVLDFQSLYPSVMIAYNYCYSTCLGRVRPFGDSYKFGVVQNLDIDPKILATLEPYITISPNGMMYVKPQVRQGLLGRMLVALLDTRVMVKQAMKGADKARKKILDARQLGLKYIANVTYGYTSASFSGRMPAVEIADSIVQSGRETLEKAIDVINETTKWGAKVVYGDTDSLFVYLPGKTKDQAFFIGNDMAETITAMNPSPIKLKFEKVYLPCVLMAKKRYVGSKYERPDDTEPVFDAKGIETVRRDGVLAQRKMVENCLKILFRSQDLSEVKDYCQRTWSKILENRAPVQDFIFAKEVKMGTYSDKGVPPPGVVVAARRAVKDPKNEAQYGERVPYVIARGLPGERLADRAIDPVEFMNNSQMQLDGYYYISRVLIPPLERIFNLVGADVKQWFNEMRKPITNELQMSPRKAGRAIIDSPSKWNIDEHFTSTQCLSCGGPSESGLCDACYFSTDETLCNIGSKVQSRQRRLMTTHEVCRSCTGSAPAEEIFCDSIDCPWFYARRKAEAGMELVPSLEGLSENLALGLISPPPVYDTFEEYVELVDSDGEGSLDWFGVDDTNREMDVE